MNRTRSVLPFLLGLAIFTLPTGVSAQLFSTGDAQITVVQTTDLHHHANGSDHEGLDVNPFTGTGTQGAYSRVASYVEYVRFTTRHPVVVVDSGDWTMGTLYDLTLGSRPLALQFLQLMDYDAITLGNHEFDYTPKGLATMFMAAQKTFGFRAPIVASNMNLNGDTDLAPFVGPGKLIQTTRIERLPNGVRVGYIGLLGKDASHSAASAPITFTDVSRNYAAVQSLVDDLRNSHNVQVVIALSHSGTSADGNSGEDIELAKHVTGIDLIASGHSHTPLSSAHAVPNGAWTTEVIDAGAYGTNVARIDLTYHWSTHTTTFGNYTNLPMTDATLSSLNKWLIPDPLMTVIVGLTDRQLNSELKPFFSQVFPDYDPSNIGKGIYHPVGTTAQLLVSNEVNPVPSPNGLGDFAADSFRNVPNAIIAQTLTAVGGNPSNLPGYDFTPFQAATVPSGVIRAKLYPGVPLSFSDIYNVLPLGISPDPTQALPVGFPLVSAYLSYGDIQKACALQLLVQTNLANAEYYLNLSGLQYGLKAAESYAYFKFATAASVLQVTNQKAIAGSIDAQHALGALSLLASDHGAALLGLFGAGNPYAAAMVSLNDSSPTPTQIATNLGALGQVAGAAAFDAANNTNTLTALIVSKAVAAIGIVSGFAPGDSMNTGVTAPLSPAARVRIAADLSEILLLGEINNLFGVNITAYAGPTGSATLSGADLPGLLANRIDAAPGSGGVQELKQWMSLLSYLDSGLGGNIGSPYFSTPNFLQFGSFGAAVKVRNASYPIASIGQLMGTLSALQSAP